jgi:short-subunit dehydrogenase
MKAVLGNAGILPHKNGGMMKNIRPLKEQVVVLIGASSGLGRQTAYDLAEKGAAVVISSRSEEVLEELALELKDRGARDAIAIPADIANANQVQTLIDRTLDHFGRIDTLMVMPGLAIYAPVERTNLQEYERMMDVLLLGYIRAAKAILSVFRKQESGILIMVASTLGVGAVPLQSAYVAAKHGVVGFTKTLQMELKGSGIHACLVLPGSIATPLQPIHARSKMGRVPKPVPPVFHPHHIAKALVRCCEHPRATIKPDLQSKLFVPFGKIAERPIHFVLAAFGKKWQLTDIPEASIGEDNIDAPMPGGYDVLGGAVPTSTQFKMWIKDHPVKAALLPLAATGLLFAWKILD